MKKILCGVLFLLLLNGCDDINEQDNSQNGNQPGGTPVEQLPDVLSPDEVLPAPNKWMALTFDDGPSGNTQALMDILKEHDIQATFFVLGHHLGNTPAAVKQRIVDEGHEVGNHSWDHASLGDGRSKEKVEENLGKAQDAIEQAFGYRPKLFRAPNNSRNNTLNEVMTEMGMSHIFGYCPDDWDANVTTSVQIAQRVLTNAKDGGIILLHDFGNTNTMQALPGLIAELRRRGYGFKTITGLAEFKGITLEAGKDYNNF